MKLITTTKENHWVLEILGPPTLDQQKIITEVQAKVRQLHRLIYGSTTEVPEILEVEDTSSKSTTSTNSDDKTMVDLILEFCVEPKCRKEIVAYIQYINPDLTYSQVSSSIFRLYDRTSGNRLDRSGTKRHYRYFTVISSSLFYENKVSTATYKKGIISDAVYNCIKHEFKPESDIYKYLISKGVIITRQQIHNSLISLYRGDCFKTVTKRKNKKTGILEYKATGIRSRKKNKKRTTPRRNSVPKQREIASLLGHIEKSHRNSNSANTEMYIWVSFTVIKNHIKSLYTEGGFNKGALKVSLRNMLDKDILADKTDPKTGEQYFRLKHEAQLIPGYARNTTHYSRK